MGWFLRRSATAGFAHPTETLLPFMLLGALAWLLLHASIPGYIAILAVCGVLLLFACLPDRVRDLREGQEVEVKKQGRHFGRRGIVTEIGIPGLVYTVQLHETAKGDRIRPSESVEFSSGELQKLPGRSRRSSGGRRGTGAHRILKSPLYFLGWYRERRSRSDWASRGRS